MNKEISFSKIYLASASSRRRELLRQLGVDFEAIPSNLLEVRQANESPRNYVERVARDKAIYVMKLVKQRGLPEFPVLGADTEVVVDGEILGKPENRDHGINMLRRLSGRPHEVLSAICVSYRGAEHAAVSTSRVTLSSLSEADIAWYWETGEPLGKAGGYAIQGKAAGFIASMEGSYSGVMGLPLYELSEVLEKIGVAVA